MSNVFDVVGRDLEKKKMSSRETREHFHHTDTRIKAIALWKVVRSFFSPNGILAYTGHDWT